MIAIIDRIEETLAVCQREDRSVFTVPLSALPKGVKEGDAISEENGGSFPITSCAFFSLMIP